MRSITLKERLCAVARQRMTSIIVLLAVIFTSAAATNWADALYIFTGTSDAAIILNEAETKEAPDISSQFLYVETGKSGFDVKLTRNQKVMVNYGEKSEPYTIRRKEMTISQVLSDLKITPSPLEMVAVDLSGEQAVITISSDLTYYDRVEEPAPFQMIRRANPAMDVGTEKVVQKGEDGVRTSVYEVKWCNGKELSRQFVEILNSTAKDHIIEYGTKTFTWVAEDLAPEAEPVLSDPAAPAVPAAEAPAPAEEAAPAAPAQEKAPAPASASKPAASTKPSTTSSSSSSKSVSTRSPIVNVSKNADGSGVLTLASGQKLSFSSAKSMTATAYTTGYDGVGTITASGTRVKVGTVAVDKRVIPLGTRVFVVANGGYVYGTAVAADTGVRGNKIDLYMNTYNECINFGRRPCTVYILK